MRHFGAVEIAGRTVVLALLMAVASLGFGQVRGDVNANGIVDLLDAGMIKDHLLERSPLTSSALLRADADSNGQINMADLVWVINHRSSPPVKGISGRIDLPAGSPLQATGMIIVAAGGQAAIDPTWHFSGLPAWDTGAGQFVFLEDAAGSAVLMGYINPSEVASGTLVLTTTHMAMGMIALHPVCFSLNDAQRRELLTIAAGHADFRTLVQLIDQALISDPLHLANPGAFPAIYELAVAIGNDAARSWADAAPNPAPGSPGLFAQVGRSGDPHLDDWPGNGMTLVNPHLLFYGVQWGGGNQWTVLRGRDALTRLLPPSFTPDVRKPIILSDGNYQVDVWKGQGAFWSSNTAERAGARANVYKTLLLALDTLAPPGWNLATGAINNNALIEFLATNPSETSDEIISIWQALNLTDADDALSVLKKIVEAMVNEGVYEGSLTQKLAHLVYNVSDTDGRALWRHFKNVNTWFDKIIKVLKIYDILNEFVPYFAQVFLYRNHYVYQVNVDNGILSAEWQRIPPEARLTASTALPTVGQTVDFDASASTDDEDPLSALSFRFDFDGDGGWDTPWTQGNASAAHGYNTAGPYNCIVEVKDSDNLAAQARYSLYVRASSNGTITIDVTPDSASWRLTGPAGFGPLAGTGDRASGSAIANAPAGAYTLACNDNVAGYNPPAPRTQTLEAGGTIAFSANYTPESGPNELTINLPGNVPLVLVRIPTGSFQMGSPDTERSRYSDEGPVHTVNIAYSFYMGKYELTQRQWLAVMGSWPGTPPSSSYGVGDNYPAYYVSWNDAQNFLTALNAHIANTGQGPATFRLPNEAEWEYACRAGTQTRFFFGDSLSVDDYDTDGPAGTLPGNRSDYMWWWFNCQGNANGVYGSKPVGTKLPNQFGLYDMSGNVWEWCQDYWHGSYTGAPSDGSAWVSPTSSFRVIRGGYWYSSAYYCRSAYRSYLNPDSRHYYLGFRFVRTQ